MSLTCPTCKRPLIEAPTKSGPPQSLCIDCGGRSIAIETLSKVLSPLTFKRLISGYKSSRSTSTRLCPACGANMRRVPLNVLAKVKDVEVCGHSELAWFDSHEFENLPLTNEADEEMHLPSHLQESLNEIETHHGKIVANRSTFRLDAGDFGFGWRKEGEELPNLWKALLSFVLLLPVKREHRLASKPYVTWTLITLVMLVTVYGFRHDTFVDHWALEADDIWRNNGLTLITYFFLHGSWMHVLGNMYFLWFFGDSVEDELGTQNYILTLIAGTIGSALFHAYLGPSGYSLLVGASGGISTLGMIYMLRFPRAKLGFFVLIGWIRVPAYLLMVTWVGMQVSLAYDQIAGLTEVSALAHLGGALIGLGSWAIFLRRPPHERAVEI